MVGKGLKTGTKSRCKNHSLLHYVCKDTKKMRKELRDLNIFKHLGNILLAMTDTHLNTELTMNMFGKVLGRVDRSVLTTCTAK